MPILGISEGAMNLLRQEIARSPADYPLDEAPPGRTLADMTNEELTLVLIALDGLTLQIQAARLSQRQGSPAYTETTLMIGRVSTLGNQVRRHLARSAQAA